MSTSRPEFDAAALQSAMGTGRPAVEFDRAGRVRSIKAAAEFLIATKIPELVFVGEALLAWLGSADSTDLVKDHFGVTLAGSHVTPQRLYRLLGGGGQPDNPELSSTPSTSKGER